tara:strand:- start:10 stop:1122 length:1113 start_codon:yes stop_codon:yes gene_type:complete
MNIYIQDEVIGFEGDRSTGNRLFLWETFHYLNSLNDFRFELKLLETDYEWVKSGLVNLPNTSTYKRFEVPSDVFELNPTKNQTDETMVDELLPYFHDGKKLPLKDIFINVFGFGPHKIFKDGDEDHSHPFIEDIRFNEELFQKTDEVAKDIFTTIHVRRGSGCNHPQEYLDNVMSEKSKKFFVDKRDLKVSLKDAGLSNTIPAKKMVWDAAEKGKPLECHQVYQTPLHPFYEDEIYFEIFDKILAINSDAKICLVHDTFDEDYNHWFKKYPKNLVTSRQLLSKEDFYDSILKNEKDDILRTFVDLLILMQTRTAIIANSSTFSGFAANWKYFKNKWTNSVHSYSKYQTLDMITYLENNEMHFEMIQLMEK